MIRIMGSRGVSAVTGLFMLAFSSTQAAAAPATVTAVPAGTTQSAYSTALATPTAPLVKAALVAAATNGAVSMSVPASAVTVALPTASSFASLSSLVSAFQNGGTMDEESNCLATAVYFEARGESLEGQLAVARVVMNRAASGRYPATWCGVVKQPAQFSFVHNGSWGAIRDLGSWYRAVGIARVAINHAAQSLPDDVLWYHADYVAPSWGKRLTKVEQIGQHIFYRS